MSFGPIMQLSVGELKVELAPIAREDLPALISPGMQQASITRYISFSTAPTLEDEQAWYDKVRTDKSQIVWGIWLDEEDGRRLIGTSSLMDISERPTYQAATGSMIVDQDYWGRGIASTIHRARTWYAFQHLGMHRLKSAVIHGNVASRRALEKVGYRLVWTERNEKFVDGRLRHMDNLECLNPAEWAWRQWWHDDRPTKALREARHDTLAAMKWAEENVTLL